MESENTAPLSTSEATAMTVTLAPPTPAPTPPLKLTKEQVANAEQMFIAGASPKRIASQYGCTPGTISSLSTRGKWVEKRTAFEKGARTLAAPQTAHVIALARSKLLQGMAGIIEQGVEALRRSPPESRRQVKEHFAAAAQIMEVAKPVLGIGDGGSSGRGPISLTFLASGSQMVKPVEQEANILPQTLDI